MEDRIRELFRLHLGETRLVLTLGILLFGNSLAQQLAEITAISNFLSTSGVNTIPAIWVIDSLLIILVTGLQSLLIDRFDRITLIRGLSIGLLLVFAILRLMFILNAPLWLNYGLLYLVAEQQWLVFPLVFWILTSDIFDMAQAKRLVPLIASGGLAGKLSGIAVASVSPGLFEQFQIRPEEVLTANVLVYLLIYVIALQGLRHARIRRTVQQSETLRETLVEGWAFVREVPSFRYLTAATLALILCDTIIEFRFLVVSDAFFESDPQAYQTFYSLYRLGMTVAAMLVQGFLVSRIIEKTELKNVFLISPVMVLAGATWMLAAPYSLVSAVGGVLLQKLPVLTVDQPARRAFQALVPEERRGRVSMFMDSYLFAAGTIVGALVTGATVVIGLQFNISGYFYIYLIVVLLSALFAFWAIHQMRAVYDRSLFNWRLKRRQRRSSVLDRLEL
ncbi:MAG: hypothetical protein M3220_15715 [Chloroflexota bacterium]|nr:hypothetical protein [Chloroflexota bacterium]